MGTGTPRKLRLAVNMVEKESNPVDIIRFAECLPCPAGKAQFASCKYIAVLSYVCFRGGGQVRKHLATGNSALTL